jgi:hypothetical protein
MSPRLVMILGGALIGLAALIGAFFFGRSTGIDHQKAIDGKAMAQAIRAMKRTQDAIGKISAARATAENQRQEKVREIYRDVPIVIARPIYRNVCGDASGVSLLDRAADAANGDGGPGATRDAAEAPEGAAQR